MSERKLLNMLADEIARELWLPDDLIVREVRDADDLADAKRRLLDVRKDVRVALRILRIAEMTQTTTPGSRTRVKK